MRSNYLRKNLYNVDISIKRTLFLHQWCPLCRDSTVSKNEQKYIPHKSVIELEKLSGSILEASSTGRIVKSKEMKKIWPWNIQCGQCKIKVILRLDAKSQGRLEYFTKVNYFTYWIWKKKLLKKLILIRVNTRKFSCYTGKTCRLSPFALFFRWIVYLCHSSVTALVLKYR